jgi:predicted DNA-binding transcriptional regulator YafY
MAKSGNQKKKLLALQELLLRQTDEDHPMTIQDMVRELGRWDIQAERKSLYDDLEALRTLGLDVQSRKGRAPGWFVGERQFQLPELKLLVDAVQSSKFITRKKSDALIRKLESLTSVHQARQLQRQVYVAGRVKTENESIYYTVDRLHAALGEGRGARFHYFDYNSRREKVPRRAGAWYQVLPYGLVWDNENYYLVGYDADRRQVRHYRVDKMADLELTDPPPVPPDATGPDGQGFPMAQYAQKHFGMFHGTQAAVTLRCRESLAGVVIDRFGQDAMLVPGGDDTFTATVTVAVSPQFWGWLFGLGDGVELLSPPWAVEEFRAKVEEVRGMYRPGE